MFTLAAAQGEGESYVPALAGRFRCTRCGSRQTEARPHYSREW
jgi:hypothetical protein